MKENKLIETQNASELTACTIEQIICKFIDEKYSNDSYIDAKFIDEYNG